MSVTEFTVEEIPRKFVDPFIKKYHYSKSTNGIQQKECFGLYTQGNFGLPKMIGAMMYAIPSMPATAAKYNPVNPDRCVELRRLCCIDDTPKNTESYFIGYTLRWLRDNTKVKKVISYADETYNHRGVIYKASNFKHLGMTSKGKVIVYKNKLYHDKTIRTKKPYAERIKTALDNGTAHYRDTLGKHIYMYELRRKQCSEI